MSTLVIIDAFSASAEKAASKTISAAAKLGGDVELLLIGPHASATAEHMANAPVKKIHVYSAEGFLFPAAEQLAALISEHFGGYSAYITTASSTGKDFLPRLAMKLGVQPVTDVIDILSPTQFKRPIYAGNVVVTVEDNQPVKCLTIRPTSFICATAALLERGDSPTQSAPEIVTVDASLPEARVAYEPVEAGDEGVDLATANIVISAGNGIGTKEKFALVQQLAEKLGAGVGASRALVDAGVVPNEHQVGQTGKVVAPAIYIALGISGAIQHIAGMKDSGTIIAINKDADAPIKAVSDYMLVADLDDVLPKLLEAF